MGAVIADHGGAAFFNGVPTNATQLVWEQPGAVPQWAGSASNIRSMVRDGQAVKPLVTAAQPGTPPAGKETPTAFAKTHHHDFHYRIWAVPSEMQLRNPALGTDFPLKLWNTMPVPPTNIYANTELQDLTGVVVDILPGDEVRSFNFPTVNLQLNGDAGLKMNGVVRFNFISGFGDLRLIVERASIVPVVPDSPVVEKWKWLSQVIVSENGTEQRISLSPAPRKSTQFNLTVIYPDEANSVIKQLFGDSASAIVLPQYQYLAGIKTAAALNSTFLEVDVIRGDLRAGSNVLIVDRRAASELNTVKNVLSDTLIELDNPLQSNFRAGSWVVPSFATYLSRRTEFERAPADGFAQLSTVATDADIQSPFVRPSAVSALGTFDGIPLVHHRPIVKGGSVRAVYDSGINTIDYGGKITVIAPWEHTQIELQREYLLDRFFDPEALDWWRNFFDWCRGKVRPFYVPSFRPDLNLFEQPDEQAGQLKLDDNRYSGVFFGKTIADQIAIYTDAGVHYTKVLSATPDEVNRDTIVLADPLPEGEDWVKIERISFLLRCRMATDEVELEHYPLHSYIRFGIRTTDQ